MDGVIVKHHFKTLATFGLLCVATLVIPSRVLAQNPPAGYIFDLANTSEFPSGGVLSTYTQFHTSFVADNASEYVSFAFREVPAFFAFDDASVVRASTSTNLLSDASFEGAMYGQNCNHNNSLGCPAGWGAWIQPVDVSAIGQVATSSQTYGCNVGAHTGTTFWCDGSVQGLDAVYQHLNGLTVGGTYDISWWLQDDSGSAITSPQIDMWTYAGDALPLGSIVLGGAPEPSTLALLGLGMMGVAFMRTRRKN
jgi:PEP-CTERM motif